MRPEERQIILDYVFESEKITLVALKVIDVGADIRSKVIENFLQRLVARLREEMGHLPGQWQVTHNAQGGALVHWWKVSVRKDGWRGLYEIALSPEANGPRNFIIGVTNAWERIKRRADEGRIAAVMQEEYRLGRTSNWWPWYLFVSRPYVDWTVFEALEKLHQGSEAVDYFVTELMKVARLAAAVLDREVAALADVP